MYLTVLEKFAWGKGLRIMDPIEDMEIEYDETCDELNIRDLVQARRKVEEELLSPQLAAISNASEEVFAKKQTLKDEVLEIEGSLKNAT
jgi:hypothetical protein